MEQSDNIINQIEQVLDKMRPFFHRDGGDIELDHFDERTGIVYIKAIGACDGCSLASFDFKDGIEVVLMDEVPGISGVELVSTNKGLNLTDNQTKD